MKMLNADECKIMNTFLEYYDHLNKSKVTQGVHFDSDEEAKTLNMFIAACLTIKKGEVLEVEDPFA